jgi:hypothetical protein
MRRAPLLLLLGMAIGCQSEDKPRGEAKKTTAPTDPEAPEALATATGAPRDTRPGNARFRIEGQWTATSTDAVAVAWMDGELLGRIEMNTQPSLRQTHKQAYVIQLHFSDSFRPKPGTYKIAPDYRTRADAAGGRITAHLDNFEVFAGDPEGELTITASGNEIRGTFRFEVHDMPKQGNRPVKTATAVGQFTAVRQSVK